MTDFSGIRDEDLVRHYRNIRPPWWGLRHPIIDEQILALQKEARVRGIDLARDAELDEPRHD